MLLSIIQMNVWQDITWCEISDLFAVFVVVHAGQRAVGIPVNVRVHATCITITCPAHITLHRHTETQTHAHMTIDLTFSYRGFIIITMLFKQCQSQILLVDINQSFLTLFSWARQPSHPAGNLPTPLHGAVGIGVTGVKGQRGTRLPGEATWRLVTEETRFTAATFIWTLRETKVNRRQTFGLLLFL